MVLGACRRTVLWGWKGSPSFRPRPLNPESRLPPVGEPLQYPRTERELFQGSHGVLSFQTPQPLACCLLLASPWVQVSCPLLPQPFSSSRLGSAHPQVHFSGSGPCPYPVGT